MPDEDIKNIKRNEYPAPLLLAWFYGGSGKSNVFMFEQFTYRQIPVEGAVINAAVGGNGSPILLLHGYPQTHVCWHLVAPELAKRFTVVCADLRGFGDSSKPLSDDSHMAYSKRTMAQDLVAVMQDLGFDRFAVAGHDRGARAAHRMALDFPAAVSKLVLLDIIPTSTAFENVNKDIATNAFNWFFSIQPGGLPEKLIGAYPLFYLHWCLTHWAANKDRLAPEAVKEYERCFNEDCIRASCEEFRAAASIDLAHDAADSAKKIRCPTLVLWSAKSMWASFDILNIWKTKAIQVEGHALDCGHFLPEEDASATLAALERFLRD